MLVTRRETGYLADRFGIAVPLKLHEDFPSFRESVRVINLATGDLRLLLACWREGSISAGGRALGLTPAAASRHLLRLETTLETTLFHRTTRALKPTRAGLIGLRLAEQIIGNLDDLERGLNSTRSEPRGRVVVQAPVLLGQLIGAFLARRLLRYPDLVLDLRLRDICAETHAATDAFDLIGTNVDVALVVGPLPDSEMRFRRLGVAELGVYGREELRLQVGGVPAGMSACPWIGRPGLKKVSLTGPDDLEMTLDVRLALECSSLLVRRDAAEQGMGLAILPTFLGETSDTLVRVLPAWCAGAIPASALWLPQSGADPRIRAVLEECDAWFSANQGWTSGLSRSASEAQPSASA